MLTKTVETAQAQSLQPMESKENNTQETPDYTTHFTSLQTDLQSLQAEIDSMRTQLTTLTYVVEASQTQSTRPQENRENTTQDVQDYTENFTSLQTDFQSLQAEIDSMKMQLTTLTKAVETSQTQSSQNQETKTQELPDYTDNFTSLQSDIQSIQSDFDSMKAKMESLTKPYGLQSFHAEFDAMRAQLATLTKVVETFQTQQSQPPVVKENNTQETPDYTDNFSALQTDLQSLQAEIDSMKAQLQTLTKTIETTQAPTYQAQQTINTDTPDLPHYTENLTSLQTDLHSLHTEFNTMRVQIEILAKAVESSQITLAQLPASLHTIAEDVRYVHSIPQQMKSLELQVVSSIENLPEQFVIQTMKPNQDTPLDRPLEQETDKSKKSHHLSRKKQQSADMDLILHARSAELEAREQQLLQKERELDQRLDEFCLWKEKLKAVEDDIQRRQAMLNSEPMPVPVQETPREPAYEQTTKQDYFSTLTEGAIVVQRGIIKQANGTFASLIGYDAEELVEKSLFDIIALEGLGKIEQYYLDRLKGEPNSGYSTVFTKKDNNHIAVDVQIKTIRHEGETAEILLVNAVTRQ